MKNMESLQLVKEQLKIKTVELRKSNEEKVRVTNKIKNLITINQDEQKKLKEAIKKTEEEVDVQKSEVDLANRAKRSGEEAAKKEKEGITKLLEAKAEEKMKGKMVKLAKQVEKEKGVNKKFERERGVLMKELSRLRMDTGSADNLKKKIKSLKADLSQAKKTGMSSGAISGDVAREKDALIKKYEDMFSGGMDAGEDGIPPSEIIRELQEEVEDLEKERNKMTVDLEMLKDSNAEMDMKIGILEDEKQHGTKGDGGARVAEGRGAAAQEFSGGLEGFLITYSDMITLILVVFVLMYSVSKMDENKFAEALSSFQSKRMRIESVNVRLDKREMKMLERVRALVKDNVDVESIARSDTRTIVHQLPTSDLFAPGDAFFRAGAEKLIISTIEKDMKEGVKQVFIDGHTDNVPMKSAKFPSNWELSAARASKVGRFIIKKMRFPPERMVVTGYGEFRPLVANTTDDARATNRRVEIKILKAMEVAKEEAQKAKEAQKSKKITTDGKNPGNSGS